MSGYAGPTYEYPAEVVMERARSHRASWERMKRLEAVVEQVARLYPQIRDTDSDDSALGHMTFGLIRQAHAALAVASGTARAVAASDLLNGPTAQAETPK